LVQPERLAVSERAVEQLLHSGAESKILQVGAQAPSFELLDFTGKLVQSSDLLALGPLVINFFRGRWCPYCATELEAWRDAQVQVSRRGAFFVAISPQTVRHNDFTADRHLLTYPVLSDPGCQVAASFGLVYTVPPYMQAHYRSILVNIPFVNGDNTWVLPIPGTFVIGQNRIILYAEANADFRTRPEPQSVLDSIGLG
jgi:peroxiredoxin